MGKSCLKIEIENFDTGEITTETVNNMTLYKGHNFIRNRMNGDDTTNILQYFFIGDHGTAVTSADTGMLGYLAYYSVTQYVPTSGQLVIKYYLDSSTLNGETLREAGISHDGSNTNLYCRATYTPVSKTSSIGVTYEWTLTWGNS